MTVGQKASVSLLIAVVFFALFAVAAFSGLFDVIENQFRDPTLTRGIESSLAATAAAEGRYHAAALERFAAALRQDSVRRSFLPNMSAQDAFDRANLLGKLQEETAGLAGIRLVDSNGKRIHFSTFPGDILNKSATQVAYRNYGESGDDPYESIAAPESSKGAVRIDPDSQRFVYSLPFSDSFGGYRGTAILEVSIEGFVSSLVREGLAPVGESARAAGDRGILLKAPVALREPLAGRAAELWASGLDEGPLTIAASNVSGETYILFSKAADLGGIVGSVVPESYFVLPPSMKAILLGSFFLTAYLLAFLLLNIRQDRMTVISDRIKRFQISLLQEYVDNKADIDFDRWKRELEGRRAEVKAAIRKSVGTSRSGKRAEVDELIDKSWDEIVGVLGGRIEERREGVGLKQIEQLLGEALKSGGLDLPAVLAKAARASEQAASPSPARSVEPDRSVNLVTEAGPGEVEEAEAVPEELESLEEAPAPISQVSEEPEELEELAEAEDLAEVEELAEAEDLAEVEELAEAEELAEVEEPAEVEELAEAEELAEVEELAEAEEPAEVEELAEAEELAEVEELAEAEALAEVEELAEAQAVFAAEEPVVAASSAGRAHPTDIKPVALRYPIPQESVPEASAEAPAELQELVGIEEPAQAAGESASEQAYALALVQDEDIPLIPESTGLELADEADVSEIIGFIDVEEDERLEDLDLLDMDAASGNQAAARTRAAEADEGPEFILDGTERGAFPGDEAAEEMEFELLLSSIDLSSLEKWGDGQSPEPSGGPASGRADEEPEFLLEPRFLLSETQSDAGEAGDDAIVDGEIPMLSSQMRELLEILPAADLDEGPPVEVKGYLGPWSPYRPFGSFDAAPAIDELPVVGEGEPWSEAEYLSPLELSRYVDLPPAAEDEGAEADEAAEAAEAAKGADGAIVFRNGVYTLNPDMPESSGGKGEGEDRELRGLVDSVLSGRGGAGE